MEQNFLYMFEFVVDDILVTKPNNCAPEEYPLYCEISFRNSVFVSICDHEFDQSVEPSEPKCSKICVFSLESAINEHDKLRIHVYKKKTEQFKFLVGCTDLPIKNIFDAVMTNFEIENPHWENIIKRHVKTLPSPIQGKRNEMFDDNCDSGEEGRREQLCPASQLEKRLLPIFNCKGQQTGNVTLLIRLVAIGPAMVHTFPFSHTCSAGCGKNYAKPNGHEKNSCDLYGTSGANNYLYETNSGCMNLKDRCPKELKKSVPQRYFACNADKGYPFDIIEDVCTRDLKCKEQNPKKNSSSAEASSSYSCEECLDECDAVEEAGPPLQDPYDPFKYESCSADTCDDCVQDPYSPCGQCMQPCFQTPRQPVPGPEAYEEFEACLNGSGLVIRVLKDSHQVESVCDGKQVFNENDSNSNISNGKENPHVTEGSFSNILRRSNFARNHVKRHTGGHVINHPDLPKIRANIKYSGNDNCNGENYNVGYSKIKSYCDNRLNKIDSYRRHRASDAACRQKQRKDEKNCSVQVDRQDIKNVMKGLDVDTRKKGIEVCYKTCEETDSDVFLIKLGSKRKSENKRNNIEIELKTPKVAVTMPKQHVTTDTQINEAELDAALAGVCISKKRGKGKKKK